ncbi:Hypothetical protein R9X50_00156300 [Acrodontium crateriforme]|uniref:DUF3074 domain-containing protein n=1 Tax=Acrodontium crateriforme TaxID=150365 RepID=A0AAQ3RA62_9PEZI|nr:Hypothetical protein R9X50_00156300 [Acrodontium crateriforme]
MKLDSLQNMSTAVTDAVGSNAAAGLPSETNPPPGMEGQAKASDTAQGTAFSASSLGKIVRMRALGPSEIPAHPELATLQINSETPALDVFIKELLIEAEGFTTGYLPKNFNIKSKGKQSPPSIATVDLFTREIPMSELPKDARPSLGQRSAETWFARTSIHENVPKNGSATWDEFDNGLRVNHSQNEKDYTPNIYDAHMVLDWTNEISKITQSSDSMGGWENLELRIMEMAHKIPPPLNNRVFPVMILTARRASPAALIVVQVPVDTSKISTSKYCGGKGSKTTTGMYCSVEYCTLIESDSKVKWQMATASDAKGSVPMWAQKMGVPGAVVKDVGLFIGWCAQQRK